jgi:quercetin dioxygenase-like cupin family protein
MRIFKLIKTSLLTFSYIYIASVFAQIPVFKEPSHHLVLEKPAARVLDVQIRGGDSTLFHLHEHDLFYATIKGAKILLLEYGKQPKQVDVPDGYIGTNVNHSITPHVHRIINLDKHIFRLIAIENLNSVKEKQESTTNTMDTGGSIILNNKSFKASKFELEPQQRIEKHSHPCAGLVIQMSPGMLVEQQNEKDDKTILARLGSWFWVDASVSHDILNIGDTNLVFIEVEIK